MKKNYNLVGVKMANWVVFSSIIGLTANAATVEHIGSGFGWTEDWQPLNGLNDTIYSGSPSLSGELDFIGDSTDPTAYYADSGIYFYFRMRVAYAGAVSPTTFSGAHLVMIDLGRENYIYSGATGTNTNGSLPDFAFSWDSKSIDQTAHGLEMSVLSSKSDTWGNIRFADIDGSNGQKLIHDINGNGRTTDGYVRSVDGISTQSLGLTTFLDYAISWNYLETHTELTRAQFLNEEWSIALGSIDNATDHNVLNADVAGGGSVTGSTTIGFAAIPEIETHALVIIGLVGLFSLRRRSDRRG